MKITLKHLTKVFENKKAKTKVVAVNDLDVEIPSGKLIGLLGPSGCGKSTTLFMLSGLEQPTSGNIIFGDDDVTTLAPEKRGIGLVFQNYALYPHMTVEQNIMFPLENMRVPKDEAKQRAFDAAKLVQIEGLLNRRPSELSGGQQQRVAIARALVKMPSVLLLDEPLSNLDAKLRVSTRGELIKLHRRLNATTIYVTHDQIEAMTMASRIVCMKDGRIQQVGTPKEIYSHPHNIFVGGFIGTPPMNFIEGTASEDGIFTTSKENVKIEIPQGKLQLLKDKNFIGKKIFLGIRPENIHDERDPIMFETYPNAVLDCKVKISELLGAETNIYTEVGGCSLIASVQSRSDLTFDSEVKLVFDMNKCHFFDCETEINIADL